MSKQYRITCEKFLSDDQIKQLVVGLRNRTQIKSNSPTEVAHAFLVLTLLYTGLRSFELTNLKVPDFYGSSLLVRQGKGGKKRTIQLTTEAINCISEWIEYRKKYYRSTSKNDYLFPNRVGKNYSTRAIRYIIRKIFITFNIPRHLSTHSLRHTYASVLVASNNIGLATIRDNLGHHSLSVTNLYTHASRKIDNLNPFNSIQTSAFSDKAETTNSTQNLESILRALLEKALGEIRNLESKK